MLFVMNVKMQMRVVPLTLFAILSTECLADKVTTQLELSKLPKHCHATQQIKDLTGESMEKYIGIYGSAYAHFHHYCWALNAENHALQLRERHLYESKLRQALGDIQYVVDRSPRDFYFLPEIFVAKGRMLFKLNKEVEGVAALKESLDIKNDYLQAYIALSDHYLFKDQKAEAIKVLKQGADHVKQPQVLLKKLAKLGVDNYEPKMSEPEKLLPEPNAIQKDKDDVAPETSSPSVIDKPKGELVPPPNPYCRFCP